MNAVATRPRPLVALDLFADCYPELVRIAQRLTRRERDAVEPTALVHETYLKLRRQREARVTDRGQFLGLATRVMRQVLITRAERRDAAKRGGGWRRVPVEQITPLASGSPETHDGLRDLLDELTDRDPVKAQLIELRFFRGLTVDETCRTLGMAKRTLEREWGETREWLRHRLASDDTRAGTQAAHPPVRHVLASA